MAAGRMYVVENDDEMSVVRALSPAQAISHVCQDKYKVRIASPDDVLTYVEAGGTVEKTKAVLDLEGANEPQAEPSAEQAAEPEQAQGE